MAAQDTKMMDANLDEWSSSAASGSESSGSESDDLKEVSLEISNGRVADVPANDQSADVPPAGDVEPAGDVPLAGDVQLVGDVQPAGDVELAGDVQPAGDVELANVQPADVPIDLMDTSNWELHRAVMRQTTGSDRVTVVGVTSIDSVAREHYDVAKMQVTIGFGARVATVCLLNENAMELSRFLKDHPATPVMVTECSVVRRRPNSTAFGPAETLISPMDRKGLALSNKAAYFFQTTEQSVVQVRGFQSVDLIENEILAAKAQRYELYSLARQVGSFSARELSAMVSKQSYVSLPIVAFKIKGVEEIKGHASSYRVEMARRVGECVKRYAVFRTEQGLVDSPGAIIIGGTLSKWKSKGRFDSGKNEFVIGLPRTAGFHIRIFEEDMHRTVGGSAIDIDVEVPNYEVSVFEADNTLSQGKVGDTLALGEVKLKFCETVGTGADGLTVIRCRQENSVGDKRKRFQVVGEERTITLRVREGDVEKLVVGETFDMTVDGQNIADEDGDIIPVFYASF
eukprot:649711_1